MPPFSIHITDGRERPVIAVSGEVDVEHADDLAAVGLLVSESLGDGVIVIDLAEVSFIDSTGLGALVRIRNAVAAEGGRVKLRSVGPNVHKVLDIAGLLGVFDIAAAEAAAGH